MRCTEVQVGGALVVLGGLSVLGGLGLVWRCLDPVWLVCFAPLPCTVTLPVCRGTMDKPGNVDVNMGKKTKDYGRRIEVCCWRGREFRRPGGQGG